MTAASDSDEKPKILGVACSGQQKQETSRRRMTRQHKQLSLIEGAVKKTIEEIERQRMLASKVVLVPFNLSPSPTGRFCKETHHLSQKMLASARENVPEAELDLLAGKLWDRFGTSYKYFVVGLLKHIWFKVHLRCLQEDANLSDEKMAEMHPLQLLKLLDAVNNTYTPSGERTMKVLVSVFGLHTPDIMTELVQKIVEAFADVAPDDFAKVAQKDAMDRAMALAVQGISLATQSNSV